jgi:hypothetical protein
VRIDRAASFSISIFEVEMSRGLEKAVDNPPLMYDDIVTPDPERITISIPVRTVFDSPSPGATFSTKEPGRHR